MIYVQHYAEYEYENNPAAFKMYCKHHGRHDREIKEAKYYQLRPVSTPLKKRLIGTVYGGLSFK